MNKCLNCGKKTKNNKFCSRSCSASYNNKKTKIKEKRFCLNCSKELKGRKNGIILIVLINVSKNI